MLETGQTLEKVVPKIIRDDAKLGVYASCSCVRLPLAGDRENSAGFMLSADTTAVCTSTGFQLSPRASCALTSGLVLSSLVLFLYVRVGGVTANQPFSFRHR